MALERQRPYYPENARWTYGAVTFATIHVIGESDGPRPAPGRPPPLRPHR
jgi:hypothetical protein